MPLLHALIYIFCNCQIRSGLIYTPGFVSLKASTCKSHTHCSVGSRGMRCVIRRFVSVCALLGSFPLCVYAVNAVFPSFVYITLLGADGTGLSEHTLSLTISPESMTSISSSCMTFKRLKLLESTETSYQCPSLPRLHTLFSICRLLAVLQCYWKVYSSGMRTVRPHVILCTVMQFCGPKQRDSCSSAGRVGLHSF